MLLRALHPSAPSRTAVEQPLVARHFFEGVVSYMHPDAPASTCQPCTIDMPPLFEVAAHPDREDTHILTTMLRVGPFPVDHVQLELTADEIGDELTDHIALDGGGEGALVVRFAHDPISGAVANYLRLDYPLERVAAELPADEATALRAANARQADLRERVGEELLIGAFPRISMGGARSGFRALGAGARFGKGMIGRGGGRAAGGFKMNLRNARLKGHGGMGLRNLGIRGKSFSPKRIMGKGGGGRSSSRSLSLSRLSRSRSKGKSTSPGRLSRTLSAGKGKFSAARANIKTTTSNTMRGRFSRSPSKGKSTSTSPGRLSTMRSKFTRSSSASGRSNNSNASALNTMSGKSSSSSLNSKTGAISKTFSDGGGGGSNSSRTRGPSSATMAGDKSLSRTKRGGTKPEAGGDSSTGGRGRSRTPKETASSQRQQDTGSRSQRRQKEQREPREQQQRRRSRQPKEKREGGGGGQSQRGGGGGGQQQQSGGGGGGAPMGGGGESDPNAGAQQQQQQQQPPVDPNAGYGGGGMMMGGMGYPSMIPSYPAPGFNTGAYPSYSAVIPVTTPPGMIIPPGMQLVLQPKPPASVVLSTPANPSVYPPGTAQPIVYANPSDEPPAPLRPAPSAVSAASPEDENDDDGEEDTAPGTEDEEQTIEGEIVEGLGAEFATAPSTYAGRLVNTLAERERIAAVIAAVAATERRDDIYAYGADIAAALY